MTGPKSSSLRPTGETRSADSVQADLATVARRPRFVVRSVGMYASRRTRITQRHADDNDVEIISHAAVGVPCMPSCFRNSGSENSNRKQKYGFLVSSSMRSVQIYQSLSTNTLVEHAYRPTKVHKQKSKHGIKTYNNAISAQCVIK